MTKGGRKPNEGKPVRHRNKPAHEWTEVTDVPFVGGPSLRRDIDWPDQTRRWWKAVSRMAHCCLWHPSDWQFALDTALVAAVFHDGDVKAANELRQRERVMGTTVDSRRDLRIRYVPEVKEEERASVRSIEDYRKRLRGRAEAMMIVDQERLYCSVRCKNRVREDRWRRERKAA